jgi:hypothetical protein
MYCCASIIRGEQGSCKEALTLSRIPLWRTMEREPPHKVMGNPFFPKCLSTSAQALRCDCPGEQALFFPPIPTRPIRNGGSSLV